MYQNKVIDIIKDVNEYMVYKMSATLFGSNHITQVVHLTLGDIPKTDLCRRASDFTGGIITNIYAFQRRAAKESLKPLMHR